MRQTLQLRVFCHCGSVVTAEFMCAASEMRQSVAAQRQDIDISSSSSNSNSISTDASHTDNQQVSYTLFSLHCTLHVATNTT